MKEGKRKEETANRRSLKAKYTQRANGHSKHKEGQFHMMI